MDSGLVLSIIVVNWNVCDLVRKCLRAVAGEMLLSRAQYEIIVVDNASADDSVAMIRAEFPDVHLIASPVNLGFGAGCNLAYRDARGEFVLLLNPDTEVIDHAVDAMLAVMRERPRAGIVAPRLVNPDRTVQPASGGALPTLANTAWNYLFLKNVLPRALAPAALFLEGDPRGLVPIEWVSGAAMLLRREAAGERIFDEAFFMFGEDMDVCDRLGRAGWEVLYDGAHSIVHHHGKSFDQQESLQVRANAHDGPRRVFKKYHGPVSVFFYDAIMLVGFAARCALYGTLSVLLPGRGYGLRARYARMYVRAMLQGPSRRARP
jgi:hypothetical protein